MDTRERINVRTSDEIDSWLYSIEKACNRSGLKFRGRKVSKEPLINAILASLSQNEVDKVVKQIGDGLSIYESQLASIQQTTASA
jgi:hypothetical protein